MSGDFFYLNILNNVFSIVITRNPFSLVLDSFLDEIVVSVYFSLAYSFLLIGRTKKWPSRLGLQNTPTASLQRGKNSSNKLPGYDTEQFDGKAPVTLMLRGMQSTPLLPLLPDPVRPRVGAPDRVLYIGQIEQICILILLHWIVWNRTVLTFNCVQTKHCTYAKPNCLK